VYLFSVVVSYFLIGETKGEHQDRQHWFYFNAVFVSSAVCDCNVYSDCANYTTTCSAMSYNTTLKSESHTPGTCTTPLKRHLTIHPSTPLNPALHPTQPYYSPLQPRTAQGYIYFCAIYLAIYNIYVTPSLLFNIFKAWYRKEKQDPEFQSEKHQRSQMGRLGGAERCSKCRKCVIWMDSVVHLVDPYVKLKHLNIL
jgi:hypothetical protein